MRRRPRPVAAIREMYRRFPGMTWFHASSAVLAAVNSVVYRMRAGTPFGPAVVAGLALGCTVFVCAGALPWAWLRYRRKL